MTSQIKSEVLLGDLSMSYEIIGTGKPTLFVNGLGMSKEAWKHAFVPSLLKAGRQVLLYDHRGTSPSTITNPPYSVDQLANDCAELLDYLKLGPVDIVATSLGSFVAMELARARPDLIDSLSLLGAWARQTEWIRRVTRAELELFKEIVQQKADNKTWTKYHLAMMLPICFPANELVDDTLTNSRLDAMERNLSYPCEGRLGQMMAGMAYDNKLDDIHTISTPTLVLSFEEDMLMPPVLCEEVAAAVQRGVHRTVKGAGHVGAFNHSQRVLHELYDFWSGHSAISLSETAMVTT
jgi:thioesterase CepJ